MKKCVVCGSGIPVRMDQEEVSCQYCGSTYDVLIHGSKSPQVYLTAEKKPSEMRVALWDPLETKRLEAETLKVGDQVKVCTTLWREPWWTTLSGKSHMIYHRLNAGAWEVIQDRTSPFTDGPIPASMNEVQKVYVLPKAGRHTFYCEFPGDEEYLGCPKLVMVHA